MNNNHGSAAVIVMILMACTFFYVIAFMPQKGTNQTILQEVRSARSEQTKAHDEIKDNISHLSEQNRRETEEVKGTVRSVGTEIKEYIRMNRGLAKFDMGFIIAVGGIGLLIMLGVGGIGLLTVLNAIRK